MATNIYNFSSDDIKMRYLEPSLTEGINSKFDVLVPKGIYRGFRIIEGLTSLTVRISTDDIHNDSIANVKSTDNYSISVKKYATFTVDLAAFAGTDVVVGIVGTYVVGPTTTSNINIYTTTEYDALSEANKNLIVVLGTVSVPGSGLITSTNISLSRRDSAWASIAREALLPSLIAIPPSILKLYNFVVPAFTLPAVFVPSKENKISFAPVFVILILLDHKTRGALACVPVVFAGPFKDPPPIGCPD